MICRICECYGLGICQACKAEQALAERKRLHARNFIMEERKRKRNEVRPENIRQSSR